jgi:hypothetical protein
VAYRERLAKRYWLRQVSYKISVLKGPRQCGRFPVDDFVPIKVRGGTPYIGNTIRCASAHACAVDGPKIAAHRADDISARTGWWMAQGNDALGLTLTMPHDYGQPLAPMYDTVAKGWSKLTRGRPYRAMLAGTGMVGYWRSIEVTWGQNGWHPHVHAVCPIRGQATAARRVAFEMYWRTGWSEWVRSQGYREPSTARGVRVDWIINGPAAGAYIAKAEGKQRPVGNEVSRFDMKSGRKGHLSPFEILELAATAPTEDERRFYRRLWNEYERATFRRKRITESRGLKQIIPPVTPELTDQEIVDQRDSGGETVAWIASGQWRFKVSVIPHLPGRLVVGAITGGREAIASALLDYGLYLADPFPAGPAGHPPRGSPP